MAGVQVLSRSPGHLCLRVSAGRLESFCFDASRLCVGIAADDRCLNFRLHRPSGFETHLTEVRFATAADMKAAVADLQKQLSAADSNTVFVEPDDKRFPFLFFRRDHVLSAVQTGEYTTLQFCDSHYDAYKEIALSTAAELVFSRPPPYNRKCESCDSALTERGGGTAWTDPAVGGERTVCYSCVADAALQFRASVSFSRKRGKS